MKNSFLEVIVFNKKWIKKGKKLIFIGVCGFVLLCGSTVYAVEETVVEEIQEEIEAEEIQEETVT